MNFNEIENLSQEEISLLYDEIIENSMNIAQCACVTTGSLCSSSSSKGLCIAFTHNSSANYKSEADCKTFCRSNCGSSDILWWSYVQSSCNDGWGDQYHQPCYKNGSFFCQ